MKLTGELLYTVLIDGLGEILPAWSSLDAPAQQRVETRAHDLREKLNLCSDCGLQKPPLLDGLCPTCVAQAARPDSVIFDDITEALSVPGEIVAQQAIAKLAQLGYEVVTPQRVEQSWMVFRSPFGLNVPNAAVVHIVENIRDLVELVSFAQGALRTMPKEEKEEQDASV